MALVRADDPGAAAALDALAARGADAAVAYHRANRAAPAAAAAE